MEITLDESIRRMHDRVVRETEARGESYVHMVRRAAVCDAVDALRATQQAANRIAAWYGEGQAWREVLARVTASEAILAERRRVLDETPYRPAER